jgi:hypothetical protein
LLCGFPLLAQAQQSSLQPTGNITGTIIDQSGTFVSGAQVNKGKGTWRKTGISAKLREAEGGGLLNLRALFVLTTFQVF